MSAELLRFTPPKPFCSFCGGTDGKLVATEAKQPGPRYYVCSACLAKFTQAIKHPA